MNKLFTALVLTFAATTTQAATPLWLRDVQISPNGQEIVFCYKGDIYKVSEKGGQAIQLTTQASYECNPIWSPDGKQIAFASDRNGNLDIFIMDANGGAARRLTYNSAAETPSTFSADGKYVLFSAAIQDPAASALFPSGIMSEVYQVPVNGGRITQLLATPAETINFNKNGDLMVYQDHPGMEDEWRKHHTSSASRDVWSYNLKTGKHTNLTQIGGEDRNPIFSPDNQTIYFLSERNGKTMNVFSMPINGSADPIAVTNFSTHPVRFLSIASDKKMCYTYDGEIYTQMPDGKASKVNISITRDDKPNVANLSFTSGATSASVSQDGKQVAFIVRGEVFVTSTEYNTTKQITHTAQAESGVSFSPDNRTIAYASERTGNWQLFLAKIRPEEQNFPNATVINEEVLLPSDKTERTQPQFSPDGKELAFIEDRIYLKVINLDTKKVRQVTDGKHHFSTDGRMDYQWSPDGKWFTLAFTGNTHEPYSDIGLVNAQGGEIVNLTNSGYTDANPTWALDGNAILFASERYGMRSHASWGSQDDAFLVFLNQDAYDKFRLSKEDYELQKELEKEQKKQSEKAGETKKKTDENSIDSNKDIVVELKGIQDRIIRLTPNSSSLSGMQLSKDGESLYYLASFEKGPDLWKMDLRKKETKLIQKLNGNARGFDIDKDGNLYIMGNSMQKIDVKSDKLTPITYQANMTLDLDAERAYEFEHIYKQEKTGFYTTSMHGCDWEQMCKDYRKFLSHIDNSYDFAELLSELLGELNTSHTGGRYRPVGVKGDQTANTGLLFDWNYKDKGMKVSEIVEGSPFDRASSRLKPGMIVEQINGIPVDEQHDFYALLNNLVGKKTLISIYDPQSKNRFDEVILPISNSAMNTLLYNRWIKNRAADVEKWSNGRLGYVHIASMNDGSFRTVYSDALGKYNHCDGIVIDIRFNGGGRLHEDVEVFFTGQKYLTQVIRGREVCDMPSRRWNKPSIMVMCEADYSNAHGTPWVYSHQKIGKLVGAPVAGTMTTVSWETLQDPDLIFGIPVIGYRTAEGNYLENTQQEPDIKVLMNPETIVKGEDTQLRTAVETLLKDLGK